MNRYYMIRRLRGPIWLLMVGVIALLNQAHILTWGHAWPLLLILAGVLKLAERAAFSADFDTAGFPPMPGQPYGQPPYPGAYPGAYPGTNQAPYPGTAQAPFQGSHAAAQQPAAPAQGFANASYPQSAHPSEPETGTAIIPAPPTGLVKSGEGE